uniref:UBP13 n=1 Tax=Arundo donax TaxID=35708 RepID=A0A0A9B6U1_ARUDO
MPGDQNNWKGSKGRDDTIKIKVTQDSYLSNKVGSTICFDLLDGNELSYLRLSHEHFSAFKNQIESDFKVPVHMQRFWVFIKRDNSTYRPSRVLSVEEQHKTIGDIEKSIDGDRCLNLYLEIEYGILLKPILPLPKMDDEVLVFFKYFDVKRCGFKYVGRLSLKLSNKPANILGKLREMAEIDPKEGLTLFEEISFDPEVLCHPIKLDISFEDNKIRDGDIIWIQPSDPRSKNLKRRHNVPSFLQFMLKKSISLDLYQDILRKYSLFKSSSSTPMAVNPILASLRDELELSLSDHDSVLKDLAGLSPQSELEPTAQENCKEHQERAASVTAALALPRGQLSSEDNITKGWNMDNDRSLSDSEAYYLSKLRIRDKGKKLYKKVSDDKGIYLTNDESLSDSEVSGMSNAEVPTWLAALTLQTTFHTKCSVHDKNLDTFCTSCFALLCAHCDHNHAGHKKLRVYKVHNRSAIDLEAFKICFHGDIAKGIWRDDDISTTISHGKKMIYIHPCEKSLPSRAQVPGASYCKICSRRMVKRYPFCSPSCKVQYLFRANVWKRRPPKANNRKEQDANVT